MDVSTEQDIADLQEIIDRLLESCGPVDDIMPDFFGEGGTGFKGYVEYFHALIEKAHESARRFKAKAAEFFKQFELIRCANFILSKLSGMDIHALVTRIRLYFSRLACIRLPLFEYGPELAGYRHRFR
ncbi:MULTISPECIES: hypothetical protein [Pseudomonas putida group]|uniref:hypothetical protein n=1 Tax=Pseudomonas putida group TaxID=136845 RepID=UPI0032EC74B2